MSIATIVHVVDLPVENPWLNGVAVHHDRSRFRHVVVSLGPRSGLHDALEKRDVEAHALGATGKRDYPLALYKLSRFFQRQRPEIVQSHLFYPSLFGLLAGTAARTRVKIVTRHHSDFTTTFNRPIHRRVDRLQAVWADRVLAASAAVKRDMINLEHVPESKISVARYGYDFAALRPSLSPSERLSFRAELADEGATIIATVARLSASKGHRYLFEAIPKVLASHPDCRFVLAGTGPLRDELEALTGRLGIGHAVSFLGWRSDPWRIIEASDMVVHPTLHEAFCSAIIESMALERPLVATDIAAAREQIEDGISGVVVPARDPVAISCAVLALLEDPDRAQAMGAAARRRVTEEFNFPKMMALYEDIYEELLASTSRR